MTGIDQALWRRSALERVRTSLGAACTAGLVVGGLAGAVAVRVGGPSRLAVDAGHAFDLMTTLLSAVITVVGVVLSLLVVAQQLASQQYSPRAIRTTMRDRPTRLSLAILFAYIGWLLGVMEGLSPSRAGSLGVALAMVGSAVALGVVAFMVQHVTSGFRAAELVNRISGSIIESLVTIEADDDAREARSARIPTGPEPPAGAVIVHARRSGYVQGVDVDALAPALDRQGVTVRFAAAIGDYVGARTGIGWLWSSTGSGPVDAAAAEHRVDHCLLLGSERSNEQEIGGGVQQLIDVALKALSPAVNDPYTAVQAVYALTNVLQRLAERRQRWLTGAVDGRVVVTVPRPTLWDFTDHAVSSIRMAGAAHPIVLRALVTLLRTLAATRPADAELVVRHLEAIEAQAVRAGLLDVDRHRLSTLIADTRREIAERRPDEPADPDEAHPDPTGPLRPEPGPPTQKPV
ncbi:MAG: DUF2254 domain-containing protein [Acidimicrobiales bacterium]